MTVIDLTHARQLAAEERSRVAWVLALADVSGCVPVVALGSPRLHLRPADAHPECERVTGWSDARLLDLVKPLCRPCRRMAKTRYRRARS